MEGRKSVDPQTGKSTFTNFRKQWSLMNAYERFEQTIVLALGVIIALVIVIAHFNCTEGCFHC
jgi:hypothetical protein